MDPSDAEMDFQWLHELETSVMGQDDKLFFKMSTKGNSIPGLPPRQGQPQNHRLYLNRTSPRMIRHQTSGFWNSMQVLQPKRQNPALNSRFSVNSFPVNLPPIPRQRSLQSSPKSNGSLSRQRSSNFFGNYFYNEDIPGRGEVMEDETIFRPKTLSNQSFQVGLLNISELNCNELVVEANDFIDIPPEVIKTVDVNFNSPKASWNKRDNSLDLILEEHKKMKSVNKKTKGTSSSSLKRSNSKDSNSEMKAVLKDEVDKHSPNSISNSNVSSVSIMQGLSFSISTLSPTSQIHHSDKTEIEEKILNEIEISEIDPIEEQMKQQSRQKEIIFAQERELFIQRQEKQMELEEREKEKDSDSEEDAHDNTGLTNSIHYRDDGMLLDVAKVLACPTADIKDFYIMGKELGRGHFGVVYLCEDVLAGEKLACKSVSKSSLKTKMEVKELRAEIAVMNMVSGHPHIIELREVYEDEIAVHLVMELCREGDLFDYISKQVRLNERDSARIFRQIMLAIAHIHEEGIIHRDIKPENILFSKVLHNQGEHEIKLGDFGLAVKKLPHQQVKGLAGSPFYMAPEVIQNKTYGFEVDVWSAGVVLYTALSGFLPFWGQTQEETFAAVCRGQIDLSKSPWPSVSPEAKSLVQSLLSTNPSARPTLKDILSHPWITSHSKLFSSQNRQKAMSILSHLPYPSPPESPIFTPSLLTPSLSRSDLIGTTFSTSSSLSLSRPLSSQSILSLNRSRRSYGRRDLTPSTSISNRDRLVIKQSSTVSSQNEEEIKFIQSLMD